jgi:hypothetical protein
LLLNDIDMDATLRLGALILSCITTWACEHPAAVGKTPSGPSPANATAHSARPSLPSGAAKPRLMIVGDSISAGPGCYKKYLLQALAEHHYSNLEFVGEYADDCGGAVRHSAVSCSTAEQYTAPSFSMPNCFQGKYFPGLSTLMATHHPDVVLLQLGVNDIWNGKRTLAEILESYATLVREARAANRHVVLVVAQIQKIRPNCDADDSITQRAAALVDAVPAWAAQQSTAESPVFTADLWTNSDWTKAETLDCVHPNERGAQRMGLNWFNALKDILKPD